MNHGKPLIIDLTSAVISGVGYLDLHKPQSSTLSTSSKPTNDTMVSVGRPALYLTNHKGKTGT